MRRAHLVVLAAIAAAGFVLPAVAGAQSGGMPPAEFGSPPSGEVPILFNDQHVYAKPDKIQQNRALAAIVRGNTVLVPLRSMFEQMGATVSYDPDSKTVDVSKPGSDIKVTVGSKEVVINGESRPLDVPPELYKGSVVVPVRVISEGMGAYVLWVPGKHVVVVRYVPPPPPTPAPPAATKAPTPKPTVKPTAAPTPYPLPSETPTPTPAYYDKYIVGDYMIDAKINNEFASGKTSSAYSVRGGAEFPLLHQTFMAEADWRHWQWQHTATQIAPFVCPNPVAAGTTGCVTTLGGTTQSYVGAFTGRNDEVDARLGIRVFTPRFYIAGSYLWNRNNYGYPNINGVGFGVEALPNLDKPSTLYGSYYYYPSVGGSYGAYSLGATVVPGGTLSYRAQRYQVGYDWNIKGPKYPLFFDIGVTGSNWANKTNAPSGTNTFGISTGLGLHF